MAGIKVTFIDPSDATKTITAEFATVRSHPELRKLLDEAARLDTADTIATARHGKALEAFARATTPEDIEATATLVASASEASTAASWALLDAIRTFIITGYALAGATPDLAEQLADLTPAERLADLKAKCMFGAGVLDFTKGDAR